MSATLEDARAAKAPAAAAFRKLVGEVSVGIVKLADDRFGLKVNLTEEPASAVKFPKKIRGIPVEVEVVGRIRKR